MALVLKDRVKETSTTTGTGSLTLLGASTGYQTFSSAIGNTNTTYYTIQNGSEWEVGIGTVSAGALSRDTVLASSTGSKVSLSAGTKDVFCTYPAGQAVYEDASGYVSGYTIENSAIGATTASTGKFTTLSSTQQTNLATSSGNVQVGSTTATEKLDVSGGGMIIRGTTNQIASNGGLYLGTSGSNSTLTAINPSVQWFNMNFAASQFSFLPQNAEQFRISHTASAVNYVQVTGSSTGNQAVISVAGSDTNIPLALTAKGTGTINLYQTTAIGRGATNWLSVNGSSASGYAVQSNVFGADTNVSMAFQPKGTGAIDLAAGSSGVNISNGGTVTAINRISTGAGYTSFPSIAISAPTTAGGVTANATVLQMFAGNPTTVASGGTGYTLNDTLTLVGGTSSGAATYTVTGVSGGVITSVSALNYGTYTGLPTNPVSVTGGTGSGATLNVTYGIQNVFNISNAGSGYIEQPTVTFSGGGGTSQATAYANIGSVATIKGLGLGSASKGDNIKFVGPSGVNQLELWDVGGADTWMAIQNTQYSRAQFVAQGNANGQLWFSAQGSGYHNFATRGTSLITQFRIADTASAVNYVQVTGGVTSGQPTISAQGSDSAIGLTYRTKGNFNHAFQDGGSSLAFLVDVTGANSGVASNYITVTRGATTVTPSIQSRGTDTNIDLSLTPKGTGVVRANGTALSAENGIILNKKTVAANVSVSSGYSAMSSGPVTVSSGISVTIASGSRWVVI